MTWFAYTDVKLTVLKNGSPYAKGNYKCFPLVASVVARVQTDVNTAGGNLSGVPAAFRWASDSSDTWGFYVDGESKTSPLLKTSGIVAALTNIGDELTYYNEENGPRYALHVKYVSYADGLKSVQISRTLDGTKQTGNTYALDGLDTYGRDRRICIGFCKQDYGVYPFIIVAYDQGEVNGTGADLNVWYSTSRATFRDSDQYKYYLIASDSWTPPPNDDPYHAGGSSTDQLQTGDATGDFDDSSDVISLPTLPTLNLSASHLLTAYVPDVQDINDLADFMWGNFDHTDVTKDLSKIFADPRDGIIALFMLPFEPDKSVNKQQAGIGGFPIVGLDMYTLTSQFKHISCGSVDVTEFYGNYLDFNPFCRLTLFLPFVGEVQLDPDEVMGQTVSVDYYVDCLTGAFVAFVSIADKILAQYQGNCSTQIPTTAADYTAVNSALLTAATAAVGLGVTVATGGAAAATLAAAGAAGSSAVGVMQSKVNHSHSGALGGAAGFLGSQTPYLLIHRARQSVPANANEFKGYPCNATFNLADLEGAGFTKVHDIILDNFGYSDAEMSELRQILADGVFL